MFFLQELWKAIFSTLLIEYKTVNVTLERKVNPFD